MYILDTDTLSNFLDKRRQYDGLRARIRQTPPRDLWISVISVEEMLRGVLDLIRQAQTARRPTAGAYSLLASLFDDLRSFQILPFTNDDEALYTSMPAAVKRSGSNDCRIAASAISRGFIVITGNTTHFNRIPAVQHENWTA